MPAAGRSSESRSPSRREAPGLAVALGAARVGPRQKDLQRPASSPAARQLNADAATRFPPDPIRLGKPRSSILGDPGARCSGARTLLYGGLTLRCRRQGSSLEPCPATLEASGPGRNAGDAPTALPLLRLPRRPLDVPVDEVRQGRPFAPLRVPQPASVGLAHLPLDLPGAVGGPGPPRPGLATSGRSARTPASAGPRHSPKAAPRHAARPSCRPAPRRPAVSPAARCSWPVPRTGSGPVPARRSPDSGRPAPGHGAGSTQRRRRTTAPVR